MTIQIPYYRIFSREGVNDHAEFLILVTVGSRNAVTFGIWKRHSDFSDLAKRITQLNAVSNSFKNSMLSWQCVVQRKRWYKCLDKDYLSLKCFLLERFMQDLLFESHSPTLISKFLNLEE